MLTRNLAVELGPLGITVNAIAPGAIATPINADLLNNPAQLEALIEQIPLGRLGKPEDVAGLAAFLASPDASYVTGATYFVDGGLTWITINKGLTNLAVTDLAVDPQRPGTLYAGMRRAGADNRGGVFRSADGGASWNEASEGISNPSVNVLAVDPHGERIEAGTGGGVFTVTIR